jgi:hypothetical protein
MSKLITYIVFIAITITLMHMFGVVSDDTIANTMWDWIQHPQNLRLSKLYEVIDSAFLLAAGAAVLALAFLGNRGNWALTVGIATFLFFIVDELVGIWGYFATFSPWFAMLTISPIAIAATLAIAEWWMGMQ